MVPLCAQAQDDVPEVGPTGLQEEVPGLLDATPEPEEAEEALAGDPAAAEPPPGQWAPPVPDATAFDWLQMRSGEWLKGEFRTLRDYRVSFDSDEFDELDLDWDKVAAFHLPRQHSYRVQGRVLFGTGELRGETLRIRTETAVFEFERSELSAIAQGSGSELDWWSLRLGVSLTARQGNTETTDFSSSGELRRETALTRFVSDYRGSFSEVDGDKTANNHRVNTNFDVFLTRRLFWTIPFSEVYIDEFQNIDVRATTGSALGYEFIRNGWVEFEASLGAAYQLTRLDGDVDESRTAHDFAVVGTTELNFELPGGTDFDNLYRVQLIATDLGKTNHHSESELSVDIWGPLDLDVTFIWDRIESPADTDENEDDPKSDDFRLLVGFSLEF